MCDDLVVGDDGFGRCVTGRLKESGADISMVRIQPGASTGVAFVCYYSDGSVMQVMRGEWRGGGFREAGCAQGRG